MVTGAAPVSASVLTFLRTALGCQVSFLAFIENHNAFKYLIKDLI